MFFLISNLYTAYENVDHIIGFIKPNFFLPKLTVLFLFFTDVHGIGSGKILSSHSFCFIFPYFSIGCPLSIFIFLLSIIHLPPIFSYPTSRSRSILAVRSPFLASFMFFHLSLPLSLLVCLHPSLPCGLAISSCFSPIFLLNCFLASHTSSGRSSFFRQPSLFVLFDKTRTNIQLLLFCQRHCLQIQIKACFCNTSSQDFPFQLFQNVSVQHDSLYLSPSIRSLLYPASHFYL